jgi:hypothetical protein
MDGYQRRLSKSSDVSSILGLLRQAEGYESGERGTYKQSAKPSDMLTHSELQTRLLQRCRHLRQPRLAELHQDEIHHEYQDGPGEQSISKPCLMLDGHRRCL